MKDLSEVKQKLIKDLIKNKKFHQLEFEVNSLLLEKRSSFLLNLLGVSKISKIPTSKKDLNESLDLFKEAYLKDKTLIDALFNYAEISIRLLKYGESKDLLIEYLNKKEYDYKATLALARIHFYLGNMDECLDNYKKIIDNNEANSKLWSAFIFTTNYTYKYNQKDLIEPEVGVISASSANQEVLSKRLGFYSDCVIPHFDHAVEKMGGWTMSAEKDSPLCKLKAKEKKYYPTYYNQVSSNNYPSTSYPYVIQKKRKGYRICLTAAGMKMGCAKNKKEDDFSYAVGFVSDNTLPSKSLLFRGKYGEILSFIYIEANSSEEIYVNLSKTRFQSAK